MRKIRFSKRFDKHYENRVQQNPKLVKQFDEQYRLFASGFNAYPINDHPLTGRLSGKRSFSINNDCRVVYEVIAGVCVFIDIGTHNQVYK